MFFSSIISTEFRIIQFYIKKQILSSKDILFIYPFDLGVFICLVISNKIINNVMKIWIRNLYFILAVVIFILMSIYFIFTALGYNYNFLKHKIEKTSTLYIKSYPKDASIYLNNQKYKETTPTEITHLQPDLYKIKIKEDKYQEWEKELLIKPEETVFVEDVSLFYKIPKISIIKAGSFEYVSVSPDKESLLFYDRENKELNLYSLKQKEIISIEKNIDEIKNSLWSSDNQKILLNIHNKYFVSFAYFNKAILSLEKYINFNPQKIVWDKFNSNLLYLTDIQGHLYKFNLDKKVLKRLDITNVLAVKPEKDKVFYVVKEGQNQKNDLYLLDQNNNKKKILSLENSADYKFILPYNDYFCLLSSNNTLYLIDPNNKDYLLKKIYNVQDLSWDLYNRTLLLRNDFEIWSYDLVSKEENLINRFSQKIKNSFWHRNNNHVFYVVNSKLYVIELDARDQRNVYSLDNIYNADSFLENKKGNILYYISPSGLMKSIIQ